MAVSLPSLLIFTNQFSAMMESKLPLLDVLENLGRETPERRFKEVLEDVCYDVSHGIDLGDALAEHPDVFDDIYINVVRAGIGSGKLDGALAQLSNYLANADEVRRKLRAATAYPAFMLVAFFGAFNGVVFFILPRFKTIFDRFDKDLPAATQVLVEIGDIWAAHWYWIIGAFFAFVIGLLVWINTDDGRYLWDQYKLRLPVLGRMWRMAALARLLRTFAVQVGNDVEVLEALRLAAPSCGNVYIAETIEEIVVDISNGLGIAQSFREHEVFSGIVLQLIASGEESGGLDRLLLSAADYFDRLLDNQLQTLTALVNPTLIVTMGLGIAAMMIAIFLPVFDMGGAMSR